MKILTVNNYSTKKGVEGSFNHTMPGHHIWGADFFIKKGVEVDYLDYTTPATFTTRIKWNIKLLKLSKNYDAIIAYNSPLIDIFSFFKALHLTHVKLYTFAHHKNKSWQVNRFFDGVFFISKEIMSQYKSKNIKKYYLEWGPDLDFYHSNHFKRRPLESNKVRFVSNGMTSRDFKLLEAAAEETHASLTMITPQYVTIDGKVLKNSSRKYGHILNQVKTTSLICDADVTVIPVIKWEGDKINVCGLGSFTDALAIGQPIIMSDNTNISVDIEKLKIGFVYKAGDLDDLKDKMQKFTNDPNLIDEYGRNARRYAESHSYTAFCEKLYQIVCNH